MKTVTINIPTTFEEVEFVDSGISNHPYRFHATFGDYEGFGETQQYAFDDLVGNIPTGGEYKYFPSGFTNWHETHYFVSVHISETVDNENSVANHRLDKDGTGGLWELAQELTDQWEELQKGRQWDGEWMEELEAWLNAKDAA